MISSQRSRAQRLARAAAIAGLAFAGFGLAWAQPAKAQGSDVFKGLKGLALNTPKQAVLDAIEKMQLGMPSKCMDRSDGEQSCLVGPIPQSAGFTLARERVHYLDVHFNSKGQLYQVILSMGIEAAPARGAAFGELGETLQAAIGMAPDVFSSSYEDVILRWKGQESEILLGMTPFKRGVALQVYLRTLSSAPDAFKKRQRGAERFVNDL